MINAVGWLASLFWFFTATQWSITWGYAVISYLQFSFFLRLSRRSHFAKPLVWLNGASIIVHFTATIMLADPWWTVFFLNRLFELTILYIAGCALYRLRKRARRLIRSIAWPHSSAMDGLTR